MLDGITNSNEEDVYEYGMVRYDCTTQWWIQSPGTVRMGGKSAEEMFEERLTQLLPGYTSVLDAGCGHGDFTLKMAAHATHITGFDNSEEMIKIAQDSLESSVIQNVDFICATTEELPFQDEQFGLIYNRRVPHPLLNMEGFSLREALLFGIHTDITKVRERLERNRYEQIEIEEYHEARMVFLTKMSLLSSLRTFRQPGLHTACLVR